MQLRHPKNLYPRIRKKKSCISLVSSTSFTSVIGDSLYCKHVALYSCMHMHCLTLTIANGTGIIPFPSLSIANICCTINCVPPTLQEVIVILLMLKYCTHNLTVRSKSITLPVSVLYHQIHSSHCYRIVCTSIADCHKPPTALLVIRKMCTV